MRRFRKVVLASVFVCTAGQASAGFDYWTYEVEKDPFSGGLRVTVDLATSIRSGIFILCDSSEHGLTVRAIPGFEWTDDLDGYHPMMEFAVDGDRLFGQVGLTGRVGANLAIAEGHLTQENANTLAEAFGRARRQIAVKDGISDSPHLMTARGSTKAGAALAECLDGQT